MAPPTVDLTGKIFGKLKVIKRLERTKDGITYYSCVCECGRKKEVQHGNLISGGTSSCGTNGCRGENKKLLGLKFNKLLVVSRVIKKNDPYKRWWWKCKCDCGKEVIVIGWRLTTNRVRSCGCALTRKDKHPNYKGTENITGSFFASISNGIRRYNRNLENTITIDYLQELLEKQNFRSVFSNKYLLNNKNDTDKVGSVDRIDSSKGYVPGNVQWVTIRENYMKQSYPNSLFIQDVLDIAKHQKKLSRKIRSKENNPL